VKHTVETVGVVAHVVEERGGEAVRTSIGGVPGGVGQVECELIVRVGNVARTGMDICETQPGLL
jgi:hypothetical protein